MLVKSETNNNNDIINIDYQLSTIKINTIKKYILTFFHFCDPCQSCCVEHAYL